MNSIQNLAKMRDQLEDEIQYLSYGPDWEKAMEILHIMKIEINELLTYKFIPPPPAHVPSSEDLKVTIRNMRTKKTKTYSLEPIFGCSSAREYLHLFRAWDVNYLYITEVEKAEDGAEFEMADLALYYFERNLFLLEVVRKHLGNMTTHHSKNQSVIILLDTLSKNSLDMLYDPVRALRKIEFVAGFISK